MADLPPRRGDDAGDARLLERARAGDSEAFAALYEQEVDAARRLARILVGEERSEELVAESFARVLAQLKAGRGPTEDFRAYLQVTIRNGFRDGLRAPKEAPSSDQPWLLDDVLPPVEELVEDLDRDVAVSALATLPKSWQQVLWHLEVEGRKPAEVATLLDMEAGAVSSLAYRAREGLKRAYLDQHLQPASGGLCGWTQSRMSQYVRGDLSTRAEAKVAAHVDTCSACSAAFLTVDRVNQKLAAWLFPVVLWGIVGAEKGGLLWFAAGAGGAGAAGTPVAGGGGGGGSSPGPNPLVLGAVGAAVACGIAGGVALAVTAGEDKPTRDDTSIAADPGGPGDNAAPPPAGPNDQPPDNQPPDNQPQDPPSDPAVDAPVPTESPTTEVPTSEPSPTTSEPPTSEPPTSEPPPTTPDPDPVEVLPVAPIASPIDACGTYGSLDLADTRGVSYDLVSGDGRQGAWTVVATADDGYVIADGALTRFDGDLRSYYPCAEITDVDGTRNGPPLITPWEMLTTLAVSDPTPATLTVVVDFAEAVVVTHKPATCSSNLLSGTVTCTIPYDGTPPAPIPIAVIALDPQPNAGPSGVVRLLSNGQPVDEAAFEL